VPAVWHCKLAVGYNCTFDSNLTDTAGTVDCIANTVEHTDSDTFRTKFPLADCTNNEQKRIDRVRTVMDESFSKRPALSVNHNDIIPGTGNVKHINLLISSQRKACCNVYFIKRHQNTAHTKHVC